MISNRDNARSSARFFFFVRAFLPHIRTLSSACAFLPLASPIQNEIAAAQSNFEQAKYAGFTEDELIQYAALTEKIKNNIQKIL